MPVTSVCDRTLVYGEWVNGRLEALDCVWLLGFDWIRHFRFCVVIGFQKIPFFRLCMVSGRRERFELEIVYGYRDLIFFHASNCVW